MLRTRSYAAPTAPPQQTRRRVSALIPVAVTDAGGRFDVHEQLDGRAKWLASFLEEDDAKAYVRRRVRLPWRIAAA